MTSDKKNISLLADIFTKRGFKNIIISPGSRNAPIVISFANNSNINSFSIVDERSAAFFALGMSLQTNNLTAIACTSGSAVLNYAPAIAEAYYQKIPLLVLTGDRPAHLINVGDGQTINQKDVFKNIIKASYELPENIDDQKSKDKANILINKALDDCLYLEPGPVHINLPFDEPIYGTTDFAPNGEVIITENKTKILDLNKVIDSINNSEKVMLIAGQEQFNETLNIQLNSLSKNRKFAVLTETTSNLAGQYFIDVIDNVTSTISDEEANKFKPDIVVSFGGQVVSKMIKKFLRTNKPAVHYHICASGDSMDTFQTKSQTIVLSPEIFFENLIKSNISGSEYSNLWIERKKRTDKKRTEYLNKLYYCDLKIHDIILSNLKPNTTLHLGNSTPVRYSQLFGTIDGVIYQSNRGVSGIDGQVSTAVGYSYFSEKENILITGDLGFLYDSNGLMNNYIPDNLKIIVINNQGGGIFRFIPGPDTTPNLEKFFEAKHNWSAKYICKAFDMNYYSTNQEKSYETDIINFVSSKIKGPALLEIFTPNEYNAKILREYFEFLKS
jgi:2-succinyl-5-enolpyruvyl-6-hydroxy-3-cyclohexene-1-carboxylate synthase